MALRSTFDLEPIRPSGNNPFTPVERLSRALEKFIRTHRDVPVSPMYLHDVLKRSDPKMTELRVSQALNLMQRRGSLRYDPKRLILVPDLSFELPVALETRPVTEPWSSSGAVDHVLSGLLIGHYQPGMRLDLDQLYAKFSRTGQDNANWQRFGFVAGVTRLRIASLSEDETALVLDTPSVRVGTRRSGVRTVAQYEPIVAFRPFAELVLAHHLTDSRGLTKEDISFALGVTPRAAAQYHAALKPTERAEAPRPARNAKGDGKAEGVGAARPGPELE